MFISALFRPQTIVAIGIALVLATAAYGFAAANTVPDARLGDGAGTVSGYTVTNVTYYLDAADPGLLERVTFSLDAAATTVRGQLVAGGAWYTATNTSGLNWEIDPDPDVNTADVDTLRIVAAE
ncbi:MAG TPA: hypothetical protein PKA05_00670 [Roseiflexaceae bacterium]|nr:hypothetical protein [Roseiflexaceae bacterium]